MALVGVFVNVLLPVLLLIGLGVLLDRRLDLDVKSISQVVFYGFSPCLIFSLLVESKVSGQDSTLIFLFVLVSTLIVGGLGWLGARAMRVDRLTTSAMLLGVMFMNSGNYGLSVNLFAFGEEGLARAALFFVASAILSNTMGVFLAARGSASGKEALARVLRAPLVYAALAALVVNLTGLTVPAPIAKALSTAGSAAVPSLLLVLGMQLSRTSVDQDVPVVGAATLLRLAAAPLIAWLLADTLGLEGVTRQVCIVEASMPAAVTPLVIAVQYDAKPKLVTSVIFASTILSMVSLTIVLALVM